MKGRGLLILGTAILIAVDYFGVFSFIIPSLNAYVLEQQYVIDFIGSIGLFESNSAYISIFAGLEIVIALLVTAFEFLGKLPTFIKFVFILLAIYLLYDGVMTLVLLVL
jgi:hypothetical protein